MLARLSGLFFVAMFVLSLGVSSQDDVVMLILENGFEDYTGTRDATLYREGALSNGAGQHIFAGFTNQPHIRRALIAFDLSAIPANAVIQSASFQITISRAPFSRQNADVSLHRLTQDWGEGNVDVPGQEGKGLEAEVGDATWDSNFLGDSKWENLGGDFIEEPSATARATGTGSPVLFENEQLAADIQAWLDGTEDNFGWAIVSDGQAKRYHSSESEIENGLKPRLIIWYVVGE
jgi:hypothetical protein